MTPIPFIALTALLAVAGIETTLPVPPAPTAHAADAPDHPEARPYDPQADAAADLDAAIARARATDQRVIVVMGANWCHDSRALAGWLATPRFAAMLAPRYQVVYVDVGHPQDGKPHNSAIIHRFGFKTLKGTPTVVIADRDGKRLNATSDAAGWRNAASRDADAIFAYFQRTAL